jgi:succinate dehydrogenase / fumarate reductase, cytochrome b subunit
MVQSNSRPISPHLMQYKWGIHMITSIMHRITGFILATVGMMSLVWWLTALAGGEESYALFQTYAIDAGDTAGWFPQVSNWFFRLAAIGVVYSFFQHFFSGLRHLVMDMGAGYELKSNRLWSLVVFLAAISSTAGVAFYIAYKYIGQ